jgi:hypothetical protein
MVLFQPLPVQTDLLDDEMNEYQRMLLRPFYDIANHSGIFICGTHPYWLIWYVYSEYEMNV